MITLCATLVTWSDKLITSNGRLKEERRITWPLKMSFAHVVEERRLQPFHRVIDSCVWLRMPNTIVALIGDVSLNGVGVLNAKIPLAQ